MPKLKQEQALKIGVLTVPEKDIRADSKKLVQDIAGNWYKLSRNLVAIYDADLWQSWGFHGFKEYIEGELGIEYRKAMWRVQQGRAIIKYNITEDQIRNMNETNFKEVSTLMAMDISPEEIARLMDLGMNGTFREVQDIVAKLKATKVGGQKIELVHINLTVTRDTWDTIEIALKEIEEFVGEDATTGTKIAYALQEWTFHHNPELAPSILEKIGVSKEKEEVHVVKIPRKERADKGKRRGKDA